MKHYIDTSSKLWGFDDTQIHLIPADAIEISDSFSFEQYPYLTLIDGVINYNQAKHDLDKTSEAETQTTKESALTKLTALGLTADEVKALLGVA
jgi:hypothetical protein